MTDILAVTEAVIQSIQNASLDGADPHEVLMVWRPTLERIIAHEMKLTDEKADFLIEASGDGEMIPWADRDRVVEYSDANTVVRCERYRRMPDVFGVGWADENGSAKHAFFATEAEATNFVASRLESLKLMPSPQETEGK